MDSTHSEKDLGIWITDDIKLEYQTTETCKKANGMLGLTKCTIVHKNQHILVALYKSSVRPHLEYCICLVAKIRERQEMSRKGAAPFNSVIQRLERLGSHQSTGPLGFMDTGRT